MADDRKFTNNSDTDDYIFDDEEDLSLEEIELNEENDGYKSGTPDGTEPSARGSKGRRTYIIRAAVIAAVVVILVAAGIMIERFVPNKKAVNLNEYYRTSVGNALIYNYDITEYSSLVVDGHYYAELDFFINDITDKFYYDKDNKSVIYTTPTSIYTVKSGDKSYDCDGNSTSLTYDPVVISDSIVYMSVEYAASLEAFTYETYVNPQRLAII